MIMDLCKKLMVVFLLSLFTLPAFALEKLTLILDWFPNPDHAPIFVAQQQGFFKKEGLDVHIIGPANPSDPPKFVADGKADIAITYQPQLFIDQAQGLPLAQLGTLIGSPLGCLAVSADSNIKTLADLKGKTIGYSTAGVDSATLNAMLNSVHLSTKDVTLINVNYDLTQALMTHKVDAITGIMRNFEVIQMQLKKFPVRVFYPELYGVPSYAELIYVINKNNINDPRFPKFLKAVQMGEVYLQAHPAQSFKVFAKNHPELNNTLNQRAWMATLPYFAKDPNEINIKQELKLKAFMQKQGLLNKK